MPNLKNLLSTCVDSKLNGILTCNGISVALMTSEVFGVFDSHSRGLDGKQTQNGVACFVGEHDIKEIYDLLLFNIPSSGHTNGFEDQYQLTVISVEVESSLLDNPPEIIANDNDAETTESCESRVPVTDVSQTISSYETNNEQIEPEENDNEELFDKQMENLNFYNDNDDTNTRENVSNEQHSKINNNTDVTEVNCQDLIPDIFAMNSDNNNIDRTQLRVCSKSLNEGLRNQETNDENIIINFEWVWKKLHEKFDNHGELFACNLANIKFTHSSTSGLIKYLHFKCDMCGVIETISSVPNEENHINLNMAVVLGCQTIGIGLYQLEELLGICGMKAMSYRTYQKWQTDTWTNVLKAAEESMAKTAAEERRLAIERNDVVHGIPCTMVEADGSYQKRSYINSRYDSPAACVIVIGRYTKQILQIIVKQKTCATCDYAISNGLPIKAHECYRNHGRDQSSTSMESAAMVEAFESSIEKQNLIYKVLISDGDSSNYKCIVDRNPYGAYDVKVKNILCVNHIKRNISLNIKALSKKKDRFGGIKKNIENSTPIFVDKIIIGEVNAEN